LQAFKVKWVNLKALDFWLKPRRLTAWVKTAAACGGLKPNTIQIKRGEKRGKPCDILSVEK
jgi:hypothetical protein